MPVLHTETACDRTKLGESEPFVKMPRMDIAFYNRIELQDPEAQFFAFIQAIFNEHLTDMLSP